MQEFSQSILRLLCGLVLAILCSCGGGGGSTEPVDTGGAPIIETQPTAQSVRAGQSATFTVVAAGTEPFTYQWSRNGVPIASATAASYSLAAVTAIDSGATFTVVVTNAKGSVTSAAASLKVPAKVAGIILQDNPQIQTSQTAYSLRGELMLELSGDLPLVRWKATGTSTHQGILQATSSQFSVDVPLSLGINRLEIVAEDGSTSLVAFTKEVVRNTADAFIGTLELTRDIVFVNESAVSLARVAVDPTRVVANSVRLVQVNADGTETPVSDMVDNGSLAQGDEVQGDGIYSASVTILAASEGERVYRATATLVSGGGSATTVTRTLRVTARLPDATLTAILSTQAAATERLKTAAISGAIALKTAVLAEITSLRSNADVAAVSANDAGTAISVLYKSGIAGVIGEPSPTVKGGAEAQAVSTPSLRLRGRASSFDLFPGTIEPYAAYSGALRPAAAESAQQRATIQSAGKAGTLAVTPTTPSLGSNRVYALAANYSEWGDGDDVPQLAAQMQANPLLDVTYKKTTTAGGGSVEDFKNLGGYGMVLISSHGDTHYSLLGVDNFASWTTMYELFGWTPSFAQVVMYSNMKVTTANKATYEADLKAGRLVIWGQTYGIMPSFIRQYSGTMRSSVVYLSICRGSWNNTMADAFISRGAKAYLGYSDYVDVSFTQTIGAKVFTEFLKSTNTLQDAFDSISVKVETDSDPAEFRLIGSGNVQVGQGGRWEIAYQGTTCDRPVQNMYFDPACHVAPPYFSDHGRIILGNVGGDKPGHIFESAWYDGAIRAVLDIAVPDMKTTNGFVIDVPVWTDFPDGSFLDDVVHTEFTVDTRTSPYSVSGTYRATMSKGVVDAQTKSTVRVTSVGTWKAEFVRGAKAPLVLKGHDYCARVSTGVWWFNQMERVSGGRSFSWFSSGPNPGEDPNLNCIFGD